MPSNPTALAYLGIGKEVTKGTSVVPSDFIPVTSWTPNDDVGKLEDKGIRGSMVDVYGVVEGVKFSEYDFGGPVFADTIGYALGGVLGDVAFTAGTPNTHAISVKNSTDGQPVSWTISDAYIPAISANTRRYAGFQFAECGIKFDADGLLEYTAKGKGFASATAANPASSFSALDPMPAWRGVTTIAGSTSSILQSGEFNIKRPVTIVHTVRNSQDPYRVWVGPASVEGKLMVLLEDDTELTRYLTTTQPSVDLNFSRGAGATLEQVKLHCEKTYYKASKPVRGKDYVELDIDFVGIANTTDAGASGGRSPCKVTLQNAKPTGSFG